MYSFTQIDHFLERTLTLAEASVSAGGGPFAALVVAEGRIVGEGVNRVTATLDPTAHAEVQAIRDACQRLQRFRLEGCVLFVSCEPCPMCAAASYWARLDRVWFAAAAHDAAAAGFDDSHIQRQLQLPLQQRQLPFEQRRLATATAPFEVWRRQSDRIDY